MFCCISRTLFNCSSLARHLGSEMNLWWIYIPLIVQQHLYSMVTVISFSHGYTVTLDNALVKRVFHSMVGSYSVVEPNPPVPLSVSLAIFISTTTGMAAFSIITWAMASPCSNICALSEWFLSKTPTLPW